MGGGGRLIFELIRYYALRLSASKRCFCSLCLPIFKSALSFIVGEIGKAPVLQWGFIK
jgi:hypothetical protein